MSADRGAHEFGLLAKKNNWSPFEPQMCTYDEVRNMHASVLRIEDIDLENAALA